MDMGLDMLEQNNKRLDLLKQLDQGQQLGGGSTTLDLSLFLPPLLRVLMVLKIEHRDNPPQWKVCIRLCIPTMILCL